MGRLCLRRAGIVPLELVASVGGRRRQKKFKKTLLWMQLFKGIPFHPQRAIQSIFRNLARFFVFWCLPAAGGYAFAFVAKSLDSLAFPKTVPNDGTIIPIPRCPLRPIHAAYQENDSP